MGILVKTLIDSEKVFIFYGNKNYISLLRRKIQIESKRCACSTYRFK